MVADPHAPSPAAPPTPVIRRRGVSADAHGAFGPAAAGRGDVDIPSPRIGDRRTAWPRFRSLALVMLGTLAFAGVAGATGFLGGAVLSGGLTFFAMRRTNAPPSAAIVEEPLKVLDPEVREEVPPTPPQKPSEKPRSGKPPPVRSDHTLTQEEARIERYKRVGK